MLRFGVWSLAVVFAGPIGCKTRCCAPGSIHQPELNKCATWGGKDLDDVLNQVVESRARGWFNALMDDKLGIQPLQESADALRTRAAANDHPTILALSGGALNGAFGAGFLNGWYERGVRPHFDIVTGVSTGALQAPFAFLDDAHGTALLEHYYTHYGGSDILRERPLLTVPFSSSTMTAEGLEGLVARFVTPDFLRRIAVAAEGGTHGPRLLQVGTVEFDTGAFHVWDMVKIARAGDVARFRQVLMASASAPPLYPPVMIDGHPHFDGGVRQQIFIPCLIDRLVAVQRAYMKAQFALHAGPSGSALKFLTPPPVLYMVVNGYLGVEPHCTQPQILDIGLRAVECLADEALFGTIWKSWGVLQSAWATCPLCTECFHLVSMPRKYAAQGTGNQALSREHVRFLYGKGREMGLADEGWVHKPQDMLELQSVPVMR